MRKLALISVCISALAACDPTVYTAQGSGPDAPEISCLTRPQGGCTFSQAPLRVLNEPVKLPKRPYVFFPTADALNFVDAKGGDWIAPARTLTDGASIPKIFVSIVGDPTSPEYINAAAVHDAYCGVGNEAGPNFHRARWEDVHVMFYDGLIVGGTSEIRAKLMFAAVWLGGPRWKAPVGPIVSTQGQTDALNAVFSNPLDGVSTAQKQATLRRAKLFIETQRPTLPQLIRYLKAQEDRMLREVFGVKSDDQEEHALYGNGNSLYDEYGYYYDDGYGLTAITATGSAGTQ
jgi:hypothetical protein